MLEQEEEQEAEPRRWKTMPMLLMLRRLEQVETRPFHPVAIPRKC